MTTIINAINDSIARLSETNFEELSATELQNGLNSIKSAVHELVKVRDNLTDAINSKVNKDEVDEDFDSAIEVSYKNLSKMVAETRRHFEAMGFITKSSLPGLIAATGGYQGIHVFSTFIRKCADRHLGTFDTRRLEAVLCILLRAVRRGMLSRCDWSNEEKMFETVNKLRHNHRELGLDDERRELLADLGSLRRFDNIDPDELLRI